MCARQMHTHGGDQDAVSGAPQPALDRHMVGCASNCHTFIVAPEVPRALDPLP